MYAGDLRQFRPVQSPNKRSGEHPAGWEGCNQAQYDSFYPSNGRRTVCEACQGFHSK
jgi:hypothetical protein